jgi:hypothetical protein
MATPGTESDEDQAVLDDQQQDDEQQAQTLPEPAGDDAPAGEREAEQEAEASEVVVSLGEEPEQPPEEDPNKAPEWLRNLRKANREKDRRIRELEAKLQAPAPVQQSVVVGDKPTLAGCDYDAEVFEQQLSEWSDRKRQADDAQRKQQAEAQQAEQAWQSKRQGYEAEKAEFRAKYPAFDEAEEAVKDALNVTQQGLILHAIKNRAALVAALGASPKKLKELSGITDPILFTASIAVLEKELKVTPRKTAPLPEKQLRASAPGALVSSARLDELRAKAERSGDYTAYLAAKRSMKK